MKDIPYNEIIPLEWDSQFFGYKIAQVTFNQFGKEALERIFSILETSNFRLTYLMVPPSESELNARIIKAGGILADTKTIYSKVTQAHSGFQTQIEEYHESVPGKKLIELGLQAGAYSRFRIDKNFVNNEFERLYTRWIINSVNKKMALMTIVALLENEIVGMITINGKKKCAEIGLVAVDKNFEGKGIGSDLIGFSDNIAFHMNFKEIKVTTQQQNARACRLYEKCNFTIEHITNVYHFWQ